MRWKDPPMIEMQCSDKHNRNGHVHLHVVRSEDDPAAEAVAQVDDSDAAAEADHVGERCSERDDENLRQEKAQRRNK